MVVAAGLEVTFASRCPKVLSCLNTHWYPGRVLPVGVSHLRGAGQRQDEAPGDPMALLGMQEGRAWCHGTLLVPAAHKSS